MFDDIYKEIQKLIDSDITSYQFKKDTGLTTNILDSMRLSEDNKYHRKMENLTLKVAEQLYKYSKSHLK